MAMIYEDKQKSNKLSVATWSLTKLLLQLNQVNTKLQAGQNKFRPSKSDKPQSWGLENTIESLCCVIINGKTAFMDHRSTT